MKKEPIEEPDHTEDKGETAASTKQDGQEPTENASSEEMKEPEVPISETEKLQNELSEAKDKYLRLYSEFENFRRRTAKERLDLIKTANQDLMVAMIPVIDDFERALNASEDVEAKVLLEGLELIYQKFAGTMAQKGLKVMDDSSGKNFDADLHEAISKIPAPKKKLVNKIIEVVEKGYLLEDKVVRYAKVVIGT